MQTTALDIEEKRFVNSIDRDNHFQNENPKRWLKKYTPEKQDDTEYLKIHQSMF